MLDSWNSSTVSHHTNVAHSQIPFPVLPTSLPAKGWITQVTADSGTVGGDCHQSQYESMKEEEEDPSWSMKTVAIGQAALTHRAQSLFFPYSA